MLEKVASVCLCDKKCISQNCTLQVKKSQPYIVNLRDEKHHFAAIYLAGEKGPDVGLWDGQRSEDADVRRPEALHSEGGHG